MRLNGLDLNLLVALDALFEERNLTAAAREIHLSQPAMSAAIARLRAYFEDDIFRMNGRHMVLTPFAESLIAPTRDILVRIKQTILTQNGFEPATSQRCFRIVASDYMAITFLSGFVERIAGLAPHISFEMLNFGDNPDELLRKGEIDFLIFPDVFLSTDFPHTPLFDEDLVCIVCASNGEVGKTLSFEQYKEMGHVAAQFGPSRQPSIEERILRERGVRRRIEVAVHSFSQVPYMVGGTKRIATMHARMARHYASLLPLRILPFPMRVPRIRETLQWPSLHENEAGSIWLRSELVAAGRQSALAYSVPG